MIGATVLVFVLSLGFFITPAFLAAVAVVMIAVTLVALVAHFLWARRAGNARP